MALSAVRCYDTGMNKNLILIACLILASCKSNAPVQKVADAYDSKEIISELAAKRNSYASFAQTYQISGVNLKRMYFRFEPQYTFRSECLISNSNIVKLFNVDGKYDYIFEKDGSVAYRAPTSISKKAGTSAAARRFHGLSKGTVVGESSFHGEPCYLVDVDQFQLCVSKSTGLELFQKGSIDFIDIVTHLPNSVFELPKGRKVIEVGNIFEAPLGKGPKLCN